MPNAINGNIRTFYISKIRSHCTHSYCCVARAVRINHWNIKASNFFVNRIVASCLRVRAFRGSHGALRAASWCDLSLLRQLRIV